ncbi:peptidase family M48-domain-containing protein [Blyttiomyces helicus]|uniref:CAAX prenyl protease n=1 Tax=Blyttiomyces helicus TaxID=388810 RepID=A0A4P9WD97_9FUNG|nr:peptidase family M48-domain-containing protein [Blyttiomyces helicus]|eukprot:RKO90651.1 peptidase family M48-domain-containing protein [Blyttiomyces helicus]
MSSAWRSAFGKIWDTFPYQNAVLAFACCTYAWETYLNWRQFSRLRTKRRPKAVEEISSAEDYEKAGGYSRDKLLYSFVHDSYDLVELFITLSLNLGPKFWAFSGDLISAAGYGTNNERSPALRRCQIKILQSVLFAFLSLVASMLAEMPLSLYFEFVIEARHGFNKQTLGLFLTDKIKGIFLGTLIGIPVLSGALYIIRVAGDSFFFYVWGFMLVFQLIMVVIFPTLIQPLFNKYTPLEDGELKTKINVLAARIRFPLTKIFVVDGSKRSSHSNAYFYGFFGNKRIVLFDTLLAHSSVEEVCGVLAHEIGHWFHNHVLQGLVIIQLQMLVQFYLFNEFIHYTPLYASFGYDSQPILIGYLLFQYIFSPVNTLLNFSMNLLSRKNEFQADAYAKKLGYTDVLRTALIKLHVKNLGNLNPDSWYSAWSYSHPPLVER